MAHSPADAADRGGLDKTARPRGGGALAAALRRLEETRSPTALTLALLPVLVLLLLPTGWLGNEYNYFMLALRRVAPASFSDMSAVFDTSNARIVSEYLIGSVIEVLGYDAAHVVLRVAMALLYAAALAHLFSGFGLACRDTLLVLAGFVVLGPDLMGGEWLFRGVEPKTFAYALVFFGFGFIGRDRPRAATGCFALATYVHFLVGGFWFLAGLALLCLRGEPLRRAARLGAPFALAVAPLVAVLLLDRVAAAPVEPAHDLSADYIYSILRAPHHVAPFASPAQLRLWLDGIVATVALFLAFLLLARRAGPAHRPLVVWVALLLGYLLAALAASWLDRETGHLGKFYLFRPSALTLLFAILTMVVLAGAAVERAASARAQVLRRIVVLLLVSLALWQAGERKLAAFLSGPPPDLAAMIDFVQEVSDPGDVVLIDPYREFLFPDVALPMLLERPTLVSYKFVPTSPAGIHRWYDLLRLREAVFAGDCTAAADVPVRYLLVSRPDEQAAPGCGEVVWRSANFLIEALPPAASEGTE